MHWEHYARAACQRMEDPPAGKKCTGSITEEQLVKEWMILPQGRSALRALRKSSLSKNGRSSCRKEVHWEHYARAACQRMDDPPAGKKCTKSITQEQLVKELAIKTHFAFPFTFGHALTMLAQSGRALELVIRAGLEELSLSFFPAIKPSEGNMGQGVCMADHPMRWRRISACKVHRPHCRRTSKPKHES